MKVCVISHDLNLSHYVTALASSPETNTRAIFVVSAKKPPFNVYGNPFYDHAGWGNVFSVNQEGM
jgi:hypothetical protein